MKEEVEESGDHGSMADEVSENDEAEAKVSDHAAADAPDTVVVGTDNGQGQYYESDVPAETHDYDREEQEQHLKDLGVTE